jgi:hypothetical protein
MLDIRRRYEHSTEGEGMTIQRYSIGIDVEKCDDANFCFYEDHLAALAEKEREIIQLMLDAQRDANIISKFTTRIKELTEALGKILGMTCECHGNYGKDSCDIMQDIAKAALEVK